MPDEDWIKTLEDGRRVKFTFQELPDDHAFITTQVAGNKVVYSIVLTEVRNPLSHEDIEGRTFKELTAEFTGSLVWLRGIARLEISKTQNIASDMSIRIDRVPLLFDAPIRRSIRCRVPRAQASIGGTGV